MCVLHKQDVNEVLYPGSTTIAQDVPPVSTKSHHSATQVATPSSGDISNLAVAAGFGVAAVAVGAYFMVPRTKKNKKRALQREESLPLTKTNALKDFERIAR